MIESFQKVWNRIYNPRSGCPDVEVGRVLYVMTDVLVEAKVLPDCGSETANWALAYATIQGGAHPGDLRAGWSDKVPRYTSERDKDGYPKERPFEEYDADLMTYDAQMADALRTLVAKGILIEDAGKLKPV